MIELSNILTKAERLTKMDIYDFFSIDKKNASQWRSQRARFYKAFGKAKLYAVRTAKDDGITRVIRTK